MKKKMNSLAYGGNWTQASSFEIQCSNQYTTETDLWIIILGMFHCNTYIY